jgi:hypothetical protein
MAVGFLGKITDIKIGFLENRYDDSKTFGVQFSLKENDSQRGCCFYKYLIGNSYVALEELLFMRNLLLKYNINFVAELIGKPVMIYYEHASGSPQCLGFSCVDENGCEI